MNIKNVLQIGLTFVGAIVGAGFASGQELLKFFAIFGEKGLWGTLLTGIGFALLGSLIVILVNKTKATNYGQLLKAIFPDKISKTIDFLISISLWSGLGVMLIGSSVLLNNMLTLPILYGFIITAIALYVSLVHGSKGLIAINSLLIPVLLILAIGSSVAYISNPIPCISNEVNINNLIPNWWLGSLIYISYNIVLGFVVIASIGDNGNIMSPISGIVGGISLGLIAYIMVKGMLLLPNNLALGEMPMLNLTMAVNQTIGKLYSFGLWIALFTTALANGHSLSKRLREYTKVSYSKIIIFVLLSTIVFIPWKFSVLVGFIYPILGYLGIPLIIGIILSCPRLINNENYKN